MGEFELKEILDLHYKGLKAEIKATTDVLGYKIDDVIAHQKETNGRVNKNESKINEVYYNPIIKQITKSPIKIILIFAVCILILTGLINAPTLLDYIIK